MTDIVKRLRAHADQLDWTGAETAAREREAAADIDRLRAALQKIEALEDWAISDAGKAMRAVNIARAALEPKP